MTPPAPTPETKVFFAVEPTMVSSADSTVYETFAQAAADAEMVLDEDEPGSVTIRIVRMTQKQFDELPRDL